MSAPSPQPNHVHIEIPADWRGELTVKIRVDRNGATRVEQAEPLPLNSPASEGSEP